MAPPFGRAPGPGVLERSLLGRFRPLLVRDLACSGLSPGPNAASWHTAWAWAPWQATTSLRPLIRNAGSSTTTLKVRAQPRPDPSLLLDKHGRAENRQDGKSGLCRREKGSWGFGSSLFKLTQAGSHRTISASQTRGIRAAPGNSPDPSGSPMALRGLLECRCSDSSPGRLLPARRWSQAGNEAGFTLHRQDVHTQTNQNSEGRNLSLLSGQGNRGE